MARVNPISDCTATWPYPKEQDGWYHAHNALRADMKALEGMIAGFQRQLAEGRTITPSQQAAAQRFVGAFLKFLHHHHHNEDDIVVPYLATRFEVPDKIGADHKKLEFLLECFESSIQKLLAATSEEQQCKLIAAVSGIFDELHPMLLEHLQEEEEGALPLMRRHFTPKEIEKNVVSKIMRNMDGDSVGTFLRPMTRQQRRDFARQEGIPFFIRWILFRQAAKYERNVWQPFERECLAAAPSA